MKKFCILFFIIFLSCINYLQAYSSNPKEFITELVSDAIEKLSDKSLTLEEKSKF